jgi:hypothetical protein
MTTLPGGCKGLRRVSCVRGFGGWAFADCAGCRETYSFLMIGMNMADGDDAFVFDEATGEWGPAAALGAPVTIEWDVVRDAAGNAG